MLKKIAVFLLTLVLVSCGRSLNATESFAESISVIQVTVDVPTEVIVKAPTDTETATEIITTTPEETETPTEEPLNKMYWVESVISTTRRVYMGTIYEIRHQFELKISQNDTHQTCLTDNPLIVGVGEFWEINLSSPDSEELRCNVDSFIRPPQTDGEDDLNMELGDLEDLFGTVVKVSLLPEGDPPIAAVRFEMLDGNILIFYTQTVGIEYIEDMDVSLQDCWLPRWPSLSRNLFCNVALTN